MTNGPRRSPAADRPVLALVCAIGVLGAIMAGCGSPAPAPATGSASATAAAGGVIRLSPAPDNMGCDAMAPPYRSVTFRIDVDAADQVTAETDIGTTLRTFWAAGFQGGGADDPVVRDPLGRVVVEAGDVLPIPDGAWPRLHGYFVCPSADALYVLLEDAA